MSDNREILLLEPRVQYYAWGDPSFIPNLLGVENPDGRPQAELWMGAHPDLPAGAGGTTLREVIAEEPDAVLGSEVARKFGGELPYLLKVLAAAAPLSVQAHPSRERALEGYARENAAGIPIGAPERCYKDPRAKPELLCALTDFYALVGFRPLEEIAVVVEEVPELHRVSAGFEPTEESLRALYHRVMTLPQSAVDGILDPILTRLKRRSFDRERREFWLLRGAEIFSPEGRYDRGLFSILFLNLVHLRPRDAVFLEPGVLHAYLEGSGIELMASSNNVLRGGLTEKHVDVPELERILRFSGTKPAILRPLPRGDSGWVYETTAEEFELSWIEVGPHRPYRIDETYSAEILAVVECDAAITVESSSETKRLKRGQSALVRAGMRYHLSGAGQLVRAAVPDRAPRFRGSRPRELVFGTSGLRGLVTDMTDLEVYVNTRGFLDYLLGRREIHRGDPVSLAGDLRPSTERLLGAAGRAIEDAGFRLEYQGRIPTPALALWAITRGRSSVMVTGSHIPFDRNGVKFNRPAGEVLKRDEGGILDAVSRVRSVEYGREKSESAFGDDGMIREARRREQPASISSAREAYVRRYLDFFPDDALRGKRVVCFQHSAVGRDLLVEILTGLGAEVLPMGRAETFVPIDTEDVSDERLGEFERLASVARDALGAVDAVVSTDGDSDRPLVVGLDPRGGARFLAGDLLGILVADYLGADGIVVPVSANDAVDLWFQKKGIAPKKTRIGSPYVIEGMNELRARGGYRRVVGWEANGGFLTGSEIERGGRRLAALPTRDAALPILAVLHHSVLRGRSIVELASELPPRYGKSGLLDGFPPESSRAILKRLSGLSGTSGKQAVEEFFGPKAGFGPLARVDATDGLRLFFDGGDIAHVRPSGNAPQLRIYAVADSEARAQEIVRMALAEPDGILRRLERAARN